MKSGIWKTSMSIAISLIVLALLFRMVGRGRGEISSALLFGVFRNTSLLFLGFYAVCAILQTLIRAARYGLLLAGAGEKRAPSFLDMFLVTATRNMLVDCFPARAGELSYVAMLNKGYGVTGEACMASLTVSILLDFLALMFIIAAMVVGVLVTSQLSPWMLFVLAALIAVLLIGFAGLFKGIPLAVRIVNTKIPGLRQIRWVEPVVAFLERMAESLKQIGSARTLGVATLLSCGVRIFKYGGIYLVFLGVTVVNFPELYSTPVWKVFSAILSAEAGASVPVPTFMSFGAYECGGSLALKALGLAASQSVLVMFAMHVYTQMLDYTIGGLSLIAFTYRRPFATPAADKRTGALPGRRNTIMAVSSLALLVIAVGFLALQWRGFRKLGEFTPPPQGREVDYAGAERGVLRAAVKNLKGSVVWSSNRSGNHDLYILGLPDLRLRRLTTHTNVDYFARFSPDGRKIVFSRSRIEWVSQRDPIPWDVYMIDLETGKERLIAKNGNTPTWANDGRWICFQRNGADFVSYDLDTGKEQTLFSAGSNGVPSGVHLQTPSYNFRSRRMAVTLRGAKRMTAIFSMNGEMIHVGGGCQLTWAPDGTWLYYTMDRGGNMRNSFLKYDPASRKATPWLDLPGEYSHEYFPRLSGDEKFLVFGASAGGHEHDTADYEIFLWKVGTPPEDAVRVTYHTGNDCWPDIHIDRAE